MLIALPRLLIVFINVVKHCLRVALFYPVFMQNQNTWLCSHNLFRPQTVSTLCFSVHHCMFIQTCNGCANGL